MDEQPAVPQAAWKAICIERLPWLPSNSQVAARLTSGLDGARNQRSQREYASSILVTD